MSRVDFEALRLDSPIARGVGLEPATPLKLKKPRSKGATQRNTARRTSLIRACYRFQLERLHTPSTAAEPSSIFPPPPSSSHIHTSRRSI